MRVPKVAFIAFSLAGGGAERRLINLAVYFHEKKEWMVDLLLFKSTNDYVKEYKEKIQKLHIFNMLQTTKRIPRVVLFFVMIVAIRRYYRQIKQNNYDILIGSFEYYPYYLTVFLAQLFKKKSMLIVVNNMKESMIGMEFIPRLFHTILVQYSLGRSDKIICISHGLAQSMREDFHIPNDKIVVIYNGIDLAAIAKKRLKPIEKEFSYLKKQQVILNCGRLVDQKGQDVLIRAFSKVHARYPKTRLLILGKGPNEEKLKKIVSTYGLTNKVIFTGFAKDNPYKYFSLGYLYVCSSLFEGFGTVLIEAMVCNIPVLSVDCQYGPREVLSGKKNYRDRMGMGQVEYGYLVAKNQREKNLEDGMMTLLGNKKLTEKIKQASYLRSKHFSLEKMAEAYYHEILSLYRNV